MMGTAVTHSRPSLGKLGADLRWFIEKNGVDPEKAIVAIGVESEIDKSLLCAALLREHDPAVSQTFGSNSVIVHGVRLSVVIVPKREPA